jgi:hypothetical protein
MIEWSERNPRAAGQGDMVEQNQSVDVVVIPPAELGDGLVRDVAGALGKDLFGTRILLKGKLPRIAAHYPTSELAQSAIQRLRDLGLEVMVVSDAALRKSSPLFVARRLKPSGKGFIFSNRSSEAREVASEQVFLILKGTIGLETGKEIIKNTTRLNLAATILTGGIPIRSKIREAVTETSLMPELFVRLYNHTALEPIVEILQTDFDYSSLGNRLAPSSFMNLSTLVEVFRGAFPQAILDERLVVQSAEEVPSSALRSNVEINCKLVYLQHRPGQGQGGED